MPLPSQQHPLWISAWLNISLMKNENIDMTVDFVDTVEQRATGERDALQKLRTKPSKLQLPRNT